MYSRFAAALPTGYIGEAEDIAETYLYLMQERFSTGQMIVVDGGGVLKWGNRSLVCCTVRSTRHDSGARRTRRERQPRRCARRDCAANGHRATQHLCGERTAPCGCVTVNSRTCLVAPRVDQCQRIEQGSLCLSHRHDWLCPCPSRCGNWFMPSMAGTLE